MKSVFFAVPAYKGIRCVPFFESLEKTVNACEAKGWKVVLSILQGNCYVQTARNELVMGFLKSKCDSFFFLDDDLAWDCEDAMSLLEMEDELVCGIYPHKTEDERYPVVIDTNGPENNYTPMVREDGCISCILAPTGFMRIKRIAIEKLIAAFPQQKYLTFNDIPPHIHYAYDLFPQGIHQGRWWGEDFAFCRLWKEVGGEIWIKPDIDFIHYGMDKKGYPKEFKGNYHTFLLRQPGGSLNSIEHEYPGNEIEGWMTISEQRWLYENAKNMESVLEIGSFMGRSAHAIISSGPKEVHCVDSWKPLDFLLLDTEDESELRYKTFLNNVNSINSNGTKIIVHRMDSLDAVKLFDNKSIDMVFIDGNHDYEYVIKDIDSWLPKTKKILCGHDYNFDDVKKAVNERLGNVQSHESIWIFNVEDL